MKTRMLWNGLMREKWKIAVFGFVGLYLQAGYIAVVLMVTTWAESAQDIHQLGAILAVMSLLLPLAWVVLPVLGYGIDNTLDPRRFAPFIPPTSALARALVVATMTGVGGLVTFLLLLLPVFMYFYHGYYLAGALSLVAAVVSTYICAALGRWSATTIGFKLTSSRTGKDRTALVSTMVFLLVFAPSGSGFKKFSATSTP
ncbi:MAG: hypothetical protein Q4P06_02935 [Actinomycetaceae bacterium]|nr:hypothetical protein [Actinomycetaceae bacterium]